jgi:hypothetical protein
MADPVVVHIQPVSEFDYARDEYLAFVYNRFLLGPTETPYRDTANALLALGYDPDRQLFMRRRGVDVNQLNYTIGEAAELVVEDQSNARLLYVIGQDGPGTVP